MSIKLNKNVDINLNSDFREQINDNFTKIEKAINGNETALTEHEKNALPAHTSEQIEHGDETLKDVIEYLKNKWSNMILGNNGDGINELKDARVANDGTPYLTLAERLAADYAAYMLDSQGVKVDIENAMATIKNLFDSLDILRQEFGYVLYAKTPQNNVMQHFYIDNNFDYVYIVQALSSINGYNIHRLKFNGEYVGTMECKNAGHGTHNGYYHVGNSLYIISHWYDESGAHKLVKVKFNVGSYDYGTSGMTDVYKGAGNEAAYITPVINEREDLIVYRKSTGSGATLKMSVEVRKLSEVLNGVENVIASFQVPTTLTQDSDVVAIDANVMQGIAVMPNRVFWLTGTSTGKKLITEFDYSGEIVAQKEINYGDNEKNGYFDNFGEPEGLQLYQEPNSDKDALLLGITTGVERTHKIYGIFEVGGYEQLLMRINAYGGAGSAITKEIPNDLTRISDLVAKGDYYFTQDFCDNLTDFPHYIKDAGWWLHNTPASASGYVLQTMTKNTPTRQTTTYKRLVSVQAGTVAPWTKVLTSGVYEAIHSSVTKLSQVNSAGEYYVTANKANSLSDFPENNTVAGWFLFVEGNQSDGGFMQRLVRNSQTGNTMSMYYRIVEGNGVANNWYKFDGLKA